MFSCFQYGTRAEVLNIILSPRQVVSPQANKPVMGIVQDTLLGVMKFTFRDNFITRDLTYNILMNLETWDGRLPVPAILKPQPMWTGKQLFSCLLPKINMAHTSNNHPGQERNQHMHTLRMFVALCYAARASNLAHIVCAFSRLPFSV